MLLQPTSKEEVINSIDLLKNNYRIGMKHSMNHRVSADI